MIRNQTRKIIVTTFLEFFFSYNKELTARNSRNSLEFQASSILKVSQLIVGC